MRRSSGNNGSGRSEVRPLHGTRNQPKGWPLRNLVGGSVGGALRFQGSGGCIRFGLYEGVLLALRQIDAECGAAAFFAGDGDRAVMVADDGLDDGEAEAGTLSCLVV